MCWSLAACTTLAFEVEISGEPLDSNPKGSGATAPSHTDGTEVTVEVAIFRSVVDGDTIETSLGMVRLIGIDTPERGQCGHDEASLSIARAIAPGAQVVLTLPEGQNAVDKYDRLIRYASTENGVDLGLLQLQEGHAVARFDSTDGYPWHPFQALYHSAQVVQATNGGENWTVDCGANPPSLMPRPISRWWENYPSCTKLKKNSIGHPMGPFARDRPDQAEIYDWFANRTGHNGDGDNDGLACE